MILCVLPFMTLREEFLSKKCASVQKNRKQYTDTDTADNGVKGVKGVNCVDGV